MRVLGLGGFDHNGSAALVAGGRLVAFLEAERLTRSKNGGLREATVANALLDALDVGRVDAVALADASFAQEQAGWLKPWLAQRFPGAPVTMHPHHACHLASAFWTSRWERAIALSVDGKGDGLSAMAAVMSSDAEPEPLLRVPSASSLGRLWWATTMACGLGDHFGAGKAMAWAALGVPRFVDAIAEPLVLSSEGGFSFEPPALEPLRFRNVGRFTAWLLQIAGAPDDGGPREGPVHADLAASVQVVTERVLEHMVERLVERTGLRKLCLAGGVALNGLANEHLLARGVIDELHIPPMPDDRGLAVGAAALASFAVGERVRDADLPFLGCEADTGPPPAGFAAVDGAWAPAAVDALLSGAVLALFDGRDEAGPRALGNRSLIASPARTATAARINAEIKRREAFRPFGCAILTERASEWLMMRGASPYMLRIVPVRPERRAEIAAVVHVDGTTRPQTVTGSSHPILHALLVALEQRGHPPVLLNTSMNGRGEPLVHRWREVGDLAVRLGLDGILTRDQLLLRTTFPSSSSR